jgi:ketosteroid isomerase-like protein
MGRHEQDSEMGRSHPTKSIAPEIGGSLSEATVADFVRRFDTAWSRPSPDALNELVHSDIEFIQPMEAPVHGHRDAAAFWRRLLTLIPDLRGEVISWGFRGQHVYLEFRMFGTLGGKPFEWVVLDRIVLEDGRVRQRVAYFNPMPLVLAVLARPRSWLPYLTAQYQRLNSSPS